MSLNKRLINQSSGSAAAMSYLVIAGGGAGGSPTTTVSGEGCGGGAGGYRSSFPDEPSGGGCVAEPQIELVSGTRYNVTVGNGGAYYNYYNRYIFPE